MALFLCGRSSLECQEARLGPPPAPTRSEYRRVMGEFVRSVPCLDAEMRVELERLGVASPCIELLVARQEFRRRIPGARCFVWGGPLPRGSLRRLSEGIYVCSAEFCFLQAARRLSLLGLVRLGDEICGTFTPDGDSPTGLVERKPLASVSSIGAFLDKMGPVTGSVKARSALRHLLDRSASPMEVALAMHLCIPCALGGYGLPAPAINRKTPLDAVARREYGRSFCRGDICWPDHRVDVEYDSDVSHTGTDRIAKDALRRNALIHMRFRIITVTKKQLYNERKMDQIARIVAGELGWRMQRRPYEWAPRRRAFRREVLFSDGFLRVPRLPVDISDDGHSCLP